MKKRLVYCVLPVFTLILEILPYGAVCNFARFSENGSSGRVRELYSYFDLVPFGYANFAPFITAVLTCCIAVAVTVYLITGKQKAAVVSRIILFAAAVISLGPLMFGIEFFSVVGVLITASLIAELLLLHFHIRKSKAADGI